MLAQTEEAFSFNVTRCRYAEFYRALGLAELGAVFSCNRDAALIEGFAADIEFKHADDHGRGRVLRFPVSAAYLVTRTRRGLAGTHTREASLPPRH